MSKVVAVLIRGTGENAGKILCIEAWDSGVKLQVGPRRRIEFPDASEILNMIEEFASGEAIQDFFAQKLGQDVAQNVMQLLFKQLVRFAFGHIAF